MSVLSFRLWRFGRKKSPIVYLSNLIHFDTVENLSSLYRKQILYYCTNFYNSKTVFQSYLAPGLYFSPLPLFQNKIFPIYSVNVVYFQWITLPLKYVFKNNVFKQHQQAGFQWVEATNWHVRGISSTAKMPEMYQCIRN